MPSPNSQDLTLRLQEMMLAVLQGYDVPPVENTLLHATDYALSHSGKMLRGRMLLEACSAVAGDVENALFAATSVEYLHLGTLLHDDIIDQDQLRRGSPAVWVQFSPDLALLSGDFLYFAAYQFLARSLEASASNVAPRVLRLFSTACMDLCLGQALEEKLLGTQASFSYDDVFPTYLEVVRLKTASLLRAALQMGVLLGGGSIEQVEAMGRCAEKLGIAFQMVDDLLPFTSTASLIGKPVTGDIKNHRLTAPILYAFASADEAERRLLSAIYSRGEFDDRLMDAHAEIVKVLAGTAALSQARAVAESYRQQALDELLCLPDTAARATLEAMLHQLV